jgi:hypothetical protein
MCNPRVYVGTYKKYNEGSFAGGWISLAECENYGQFLSKCRNLHKNERDPEFMIQDNEDFPDGLDCMEWLSEQEFNDVKAAMKEEDKPSLTIVDYSEKAFAVIGNTRECKDELKRLGGRFNGKLSCGAGWIFSNKSRQAVEAFIGGNPATIKAEKVSNKFADWLKEFIETQVTREDDKKYYTKQNVGAVKIDGHYYLIKKPSISNRFCFHDEGPNYEFYKTLTADDNKMREYFISENESEFTNKLNRIKEGDEVRVKECDYLNQMALYIGGDYWDRQEGRKATEEEQKLIVEGLQYGLTMFRKRLDSYLKKYGLSKIHTWTYWADA